MARGILQAMIMSRVLSETEYGTYLEGMTEPSCWQSCEHR